MRSWITTVGLIAIVATIVAAISGAFSDGATPAPAYAPRAVRVVQRPVTATVPFTPTRHADGSTGSVGVQSASPSRLRLTIRLAVTQPRYGVALWSSRRHWKGLYAGYRGQNVQVLTIRSARLFARPLLVVGQQIVRRHVVYRRIGGQVFRMPTARVSYRQLLRIKTASILARLLRAKASKYAGEGVSPVSGLR